MKDTLGNELQDKLDEYYFHRDTGSILELKNKSDLVGRFYLIEDGKRVKCKQYREKDYETRICKLENVEKI